ncbi:MAG: ferritin-like domain-containing protein [Acidobacteriota bacterium]
MSSVDSMEKLFLAELKDLYSAENQITKALPKMAKAASSQDLRNAFEHHLKETEEQIQRLEQIFEMIGESPKGKTCEGLKGILEEGERMMHEAPEGPLRDEAMIAGAQRVEHYEMAAYGTVRTYAERLGKQQMVQLLERTLEEEKNADKKLTEVSAKVHGQVRRAA